MRKTAPLFAIITSLLAGCVEEDAPAPVILGGDRDAHGCIPSAGYQWSEAEQACIRPWEHNVQTGN